MNQPVISVEHLSKKYNLGVISTGTLSHDLNKWWARSRGKPDLYAKISEADHGNHQGDSILALDDVSFTVEQGEVLGIIGANGAGKSTLLKILSQVTAPTSGVVKVKGRIGSLLEVGTGFHPELTGRENVYLNGAILGMRKDEVDRKFDEIVDFSGVEQFIDTPVKRYSSGMYVRLAFAVAAHLELEILIVDEVLAVGDAEFQKKCLGKMGDVASKGRTVLFVSHNMVSIRKLCSRAILINNGQVEADDSPEKIVNLYLDGTNTGVNSRNWEFDKTAPQNGIARIKRVSISDRNGQVVENLDTDMPFNIDIEYEITKEGASIGFAILLYDAENNLVLSSINNHEPFCYGKPMHIGVYRTICQVPGMLLNNGNFKIGVNFMSYGYRDPVTLFETLRIQIIDGPKVRGDFHGTYAGSFRPALKWQTTLITKE